MKINGTYYGDHAGLYHHHHHYRHLVNKDITRHLGVRVNVPPPPPPLLARVEIATVHNAITHAYKAYDDWSINDMNSESHFQTRLIDNSW